MKSYKEKYLKYKNKYVTTKKLYQSVGQFENSLTDWADYIIVGAGAAGSVVAARLAENLDNKVLVLELGPDNQNNPDIMNPKEAPLLWNNPDGPQPSPTCLAFRTKIQDERAYNYPRGNGAGGSTNHHQLIDGRGSKKVYDHISEIVGDNTWSSENVWKYFNKMESYNVPFVDMRFHGSNGWLQIKHQEINSKLQRDYMFTTNIVTGAPIRYDFSSDPNDSSGIGWCDMQIDKDGERSFSFKNLLVPMLQKSNNIVVLFDKLVTKIFLEATDNLTYRAIGVETLDSKETPYEVDCTINGKNKSSSNGSHIIGTPIMYRARKEIILCGGAINTPQLLLLSGIGPSEHLKMHNIPVLLDMPGVGSNLMDHHEVGLTYEVNPLVHVWPSQATNIIKTINALSEEFYNEFAKTKEYLSQFAANEDGMIMFDWFSGFDQDDEYDLHIHSGNSFFFDFDFDSTEPLPNGKQRRDYFHSQFYLDKFVKQDDIYLPHVFHTFLIEVLKISRADGTIRLANANPITAPVIDLGLYLDDEACERMAMGILMMRKIVMHPALRSYYKLDPKGRPVEIFPGYHIETIDDLKAYLKKWSSFGHHISGTAKMCNTSKQSTAAAIANGGVIDSKLRVLNVPNLRVADTSIYPQPFLHYYNTSRAAYVVGEIAADIILKNMPSNMP